MSGAVLVLGATGTIGRAAVEAAIAAGHPVIAVARGCSALCTLEAAAPQADLTCIRASLSSERGGARLLARLRRMAVPIAGVVVALRGCDERGRVLDGSTDALRGCVDEDVQPVLVAARHLLPWLAESSPGARFVVVGGPGGDAPWAGYGHRSIAAAALKMLVRVLHEETRATGVRVQMLDVAQPACTESNRGHACPHWPRVQSIGEQAISLATAARDRQAPAVVAYREAVALPARDTASPHITSARALLSALTSLHSPKEPRP